MEDRSGIASPKLVDQALCGLVPAIVQRKTLIEQLGVRNIVHLLWVLQDIGHNGIYLFKLLPFFIVDFLVKSIFELGEAVLLV